MCSKQAQYIVAYWQQSVWNCLTRLHSYKAGTAEWSNVHTVYFPLICSACTSTYNVRMNMHTPDLVRKMLNSSSIWSVYMHHSPYDHDHTPQNEVGSRRHQGYVRMDTELPWHCRACHVIRARDIPLARSRGSDWLLTTGLWRDALCAFPALRRFEATVWLSAYASMKNAQAQVWKGKHQIISQSPRNWYRYQRETPITLFAMLSLDMRLTIAWSS